jgi:hypothetical protein
VEAGVAEAIVAEEAEAVIVVVEVAVEVVVVAEGEDRMNASNLKTKRRESQKSTTSALTVEPSLHSGASLKLPTGQFLNGRPPSF